MSTLKQLLNGDVIDKGLALANAAAIRIAQSFNKLAANARAHSYWHYDEYLEYAAKLVAQVAGWCRRLWRQLAP